MAFGSPSSRRSGFGSAASSQPMGARGPSAPQRSSVPAGRADSGKPKSSWSTCASLYDSYHSCMEVQVVAEFYRTALAIKLAPVYAERRGPDEGQGATGKKYDHDSSCMVVLDLPEAIAFRAQLESFIGGRLTEVVIPRQETKRFVLAGVSAFYEADHPEFKTHLGGLVFAIEEDASARSDGRHIIFVSRPSEVVLDNGAEPTTFFPEMQALLAVIDSYISNVARVDFASVRLLEQRTAENAPPAGPTAAMPVRRTGGLAPAASRSSVAPAVTAPRQAVQSSASVSEDDIDAALSGGKSDKMLDDVLGEQPKF